MMIDPAGTFVIGHMGRIEDVDDRACTLLGYSLAELRALHGSQLIPPPDRAAVAVSLDRMRRGEVNRRRGRLLRKDGTAIPVEVTAHRGRGEQLTLTVQLVPGDAQP
jgi:PAS domain S-box-containing protein